MNRNTLPILTDADVERLADMPALVDAMIEALRTKARGRLVAPPRHGVEFAEGSLVFTVGGTDALAGFRAYQTFESGVVDDQQIVCVWDTATARLKGVVLGNRLGALRTGALGGAAIELLAGRDARTCGVIGTGRQAETQLMAAAAVRSLEDVRVFSRDRANRQRFATAAEARLGLTVRPVDWARDAAEGAEILICATNAASPVIEAGWIAPGTHVTTVGPKAKDRHEVPPELADRAAVVATDSPAQIEAQGGGHFLAGVDAADRLVDLADIAASDRPARSSGDDITLYLSAGLAGTEVIAAGRLITLWREEQKRSEHGR